KWDLINKEEQEKLRREYDDYMKKSLKFIRFAPVVFISAKERKGIAGLVDVVLRVENQYNFRVKTSVLNKVFNEAIFVKAPSSKKGKLKIYYISQVSTAPPAFALFLNSKDRLHLTYLRYLENRLREAFGFEGAPIKFYLKQKEKEKKI
ncbi:MAG TPA: hypothetical protein ENN55_02575, partial [Firmicutes bacterium]|nr:hypothetical protein [Bacillota bacterium]